MITEPINVVYVDDDIDQGVSQYLSEFCSNYADANLQYAEETFLIQDTYDKLLCKESIRTANVLLIDSKLFEDATAGEKRYTGEEFRIIINKVFPYTEVIVITQNKLDIEWHIVEKCKSFRTYDEAMEYYEKELRPVLETSLRRIIDSRKIINKLEVEDTLDRVLLERIKRISQGQSEYDDLTTQDIDEFVRAFQELISRG